MNVRIHHGIFANLICATLLGASAVAGIEPGEIVREVACEESPDHGYALYLPSGYTPERSWPLILAFDPSGQGQQPVEVLQGAAEEFGYIVAGSNDSRNFNPWADNLGAAAAMWKDVAGRFSVDGARVYTTGFSGGARVATEVALQTGVVAGVFVHGGGFREKDGIDADFQFALVGASGSGDMNHREIEDNHRKLRKQRRATRHLYFEGGHEWAPPDVARRGVAWFEIRAHRLESYAAEPAPADELYAEALEGARQLQSAGEPYRARLEYQQIGTDFVGLVDLVEVVQALERLETDPGMTHDRKQASRWRKNEESQRRKLAAAMRRVEAAAGDPAPRKAALHGLRLSMSVVERDEESGERYRSDVARRLRGFVSTVGIEWSIRATKEGNLHGATTFAEIALQGDYLNPWLHVRLAATHARRGNQRGALESLALAVDLGFEDAAALRESDAFDNLRENDDFLKIVESLESTAGS